MKLCLELIILLPLLGAVCNALLGSRVPRRFVETIACSVICGSFVSVCAAFLTFKGAETVEIGSWLSDFDLKASLTLYIDPLSLSLCLMISFVCALIHVYSVGYIKGDPSYVRYFALLNLFVAAMLTLVLAENLLLLYLGWEGVGFCSYALIGFWYREKNNVDAGRKAFIVTRIGDTALLIAIVRLFELCGTESITMINQSGVGIPSESVTAIGFLMLIGAMGKSAQLPLMVWLPDAMAGPTPVSAQIHAATMVTAGVYLLMRMFPLISGSPVVLAAIAVTGAVTAFYGATCALAQRDLKRILAFSTISQIGYMMLGVGAGSIVPATFHLIVHAFFKALLFLGAGCVITAMHHQQDIFRMEGVKRSIPATYWSFLSGALCLAGIPLTGGFFSKDSIFEAVWRQGGALYGSLFALGLISAFLTSLYSFRMMYLVFGGEGKGGTTPPRVMEMMLVPLAILGFLGGALNLPAYLGEGMLATFIQPSIGEAQPHLSHAAELALQGVAAIVSLCGLALAHYRYGGRRRVARIADAERTPSLLTSYFLNGWHVDKLYDFLFVRPYKQIARFLWERVDEGGIDDSLDAVAALIGRTGRMLDSWGGGKVSSYIVSMAVGAALIFAYMVWIVT
jgi:NADH-quinone oxidoreductase subunit L